MYADGRGWLYMCVCVHGQVGVSGWACEAVCVRVYQAVCVRLSICQCGRALWVLTSCAKPLAASWLKIRLHH